MKGRTTLYFASLTALCAIPSVLFYEHAHGYVGFSDRIIQVIASSFRIVKTDVALLGELTPAVAAGVVSALSPRPMPKTIGLVSILICLGGYIGYLGLTNHSAGGVFLSEASMREAFETYIDGNVHRNELDDSLTSIESFFASVRVFYLVAGFSIAGLMLNDAGKIKNASDE